MRTSCGHLPVLRRRTWWDERVTDSLAPWPTSHAAAGVGEPRRVPGVLQAAAVVTWVVATGTAVLTLFLAAVILLVAAPIFEHFESGAGNPRWYVVSAALVVLALSAAADLVAFAVVRGHRWAHRTLIVLSVATALAGIMLASLVAPLVVTAAAVAVVVLLLQRDARAWFGGQQTQPAA